MRQPTADECYANARIELPDGRHGFAVWYPQMGGYVGKAIIVDFTPGDEHSCFDVYIWHDGEFPFSEDGEPVQLHHCSAEQFISFGRTVKGILGRNSDG